MTNNLIKILFVGPLCKNAVENQKMLLSGSLPIEGHFALTAMEALDYLRQCRVDHSFPKVIILDETIHPQLMKRFLMSYRQDFFAGYMETLLFVGTAAPSTAANLDPLPLIHGQIQQPLTKKIFLDQIYSLISVTVF